MKNLQWIRPTVYILALISLAAAVVGYFLLPDTLVMQVTSSGQPGNTMPKLLGLAIPLALSGFSLYWVRSENNANKALITAVVPVLIFVFTFVMNH